MMTNDLEKQIREKEERLDLWNSKKKKEADKEIKSKEIFNGMSFHAGSLYWAKLGENIGIEINKFRPVIILSTERLNKGQAIVAPLSTKGGTIDSNYHPKHLEYVINKLDIKELNENSNLKIKDFSIIKIAQLRVISAARLDEKIGYIDSDKMKLIKNRVKTLFDL